MVERAEDGVEAPAVELERNVRFGRHLACCVDQLMGARAIPAWCVRVPDRPKPIEEVLHIPVRDRDDDVGDVEGNWLRCHRSSVRCVEDERVPRSIPLTTEVKPQLSGVPGVDSELGLEAVVESTPNSPSSLLLASRWLPTAKRIGGHSSKPGSFCHAGVVPSSATTCIRSPGWTHVSSHGAPGPASADLSP